MDTMEPMDTSEVIARFGFDPDHTFPNRDFWSVEDGRLHVVLPHGELSDEERAQLETVEVDPSTLPNHDCTFLGADGKELVFLPLDGSVGPSSSGTPGSKGSKAPRVGLVKRLVGALVRLPVVFKIC